MSTSLEYRTFQSVELRAQERRIEGYAALFNSDSKEMYGFIEQIAPGAFSSSLARDLRADPVLFFWNHDAGKPLASTRPGTLVLREDSRGLEFAADLVNTSWANDALESVRAGLSGASFGFATIRDEWEENRRRLIELRLYEITLTPMPAYPDTLGLQTARARGLKSHPVLDRYYRKLKLKSKIMRL